MKVPSNERPGGEYPSVSQPVVAPRFKVRDHLSIGGLTAGKIYSGKRDGEWVNLKSNDKGEPQSYYAYRFEEVEETGPGLESMSKSDSKENTEADPNGVPANAPGSKLDAGKPRPALVLGEFSRALSAVVDIGTFGASKYTPKGWVSVPDGQERYADAAWRHQLKVWKGEKFDNGKGGTGGLHKAQVIWNLLAELELELRAEEKQ